MENSQEKPPGVTRSAEELHADPASWKLGIFYFSPADRRIVVPKRIQGLGWTLNFARPAAYTWMVGILTFAWGTIALAKMAGAPRETLTLVKLALAVAIIVFCSRAANASIRR